MTILLDTQAFLFVVDETLGTLTPTAKSAIANAHSVTISAVTLYEIGQLVRLGRLPLSDDDLNGIEAHCDSIGIGIAATQPRHYLSAARLDWDNRDPFDRIIMSVAMASGAALITKDRKIAAYAAANPKDLRVIW